MAVGHTTILRLPCTTYAEFNVFLINKALKGHVIHRESGLNDVQCMEKCIQFTKCRSYNLNRSLKLCELNAKTLGDNETELSDEHGWIYKSTDYNSKLVTQFMY